MTNEKIARMCELQAAIDAARAELDALKAEARAEAQGEPLTLVYGSYTVSVTRPGKATETLDTAAFRAKAPKLFAECISKYRKVGTPKAASVTAKIAK